MNTDSVGPLYDKSSLPLQRRETSKPMAVRRVGKSKKSQTEIEKTALKVSPSAQRLASESVVSKAKTHIRKLSDTIEHIVELVISEDSNKKTPTQKPQPIKNKAFEEAKEVTNAVRTHQLLEAVDPQIELGKKLTTLDQQISTLNTQQKLIATKEGIQTIARKQSRLGTPFTSKETVEAATHIIDTVEEALSKNLLHYNGVNAVGKKEDFHLLILLKKLGDSEWGKNVLLKNPELYKKFCQVQIRFLNSISPRASAELTTQLNSLMTNKQATKEQLSNFITRLGSLVKDYHLPGLADKAGLMESISKRVVATKLSGTTASKFKAGMKLYREFKKVYVSLPDSLREFYKPVLAKFTRKLTIHLHGTLADLDKVFKDTNLPAEKVKQANHVMEEFYKTEMKFMTSLKVLTEKTWDLKENEKGTFYDALYQSGAIDAQEHAFLSSGLEPAIKSSQKLLDELADLKPGSGVDVKERTLSLLKALSPRLMSRHFHHLFPLVANYPRALEIMQKVAQHPQGKLLLEQFVKRNEMLGLDSFLILAAQRGPRYGLLTRDFAKTWNHLDANSPAGQVFTLAQDFLDLMTDKQNLSV